MAIKFSGIGHVAIRCKNFDREFNFYTKVLGFEKILDIYDINQEIWITYLRVKKGQYIELFHKTKCHPQDKYIGDNEQCNRSPFNFVFEMESLSDFIMNIKGCNDTINISEIKNVLNCTDGAVIVDPEGNECQCLDWGH